ncbi:DNA topoisomerase I [Clostridioides difficile]|nr:DNA topoisomerase I [Clostridioides difficile]
MHLAHILNLDESEDCRIEFNEITKDAIKKAIKHPRNCLLYTSPSPRDRQKSRMPSSA